MLGCKGFKGVKTITSSIVLVTTTVNITNNQLELKANTQDEKKGTTDCLLDLVLYMTSWSGGASFPDKSHTHTVSEH